MKKLLILAGALAVSTPLIAAPMTEVMITKVDDDNIDESVALDDHNVVVHTKFGEYFNVFFAKPCPSLLGKENPYYMPNSQGNFGKGDTVRFKKEKCTSDSVVKSGPPPAKAKN